MDPGLDGLYSQTLARSAHLPYFTDIISILALIAEPIPISGIAELLGIQASAVAHVLVDLQAIVQVPGTDDAPVTFYHTSLRDFLTTENRSGQLFVSPSYHVRLLISCLSCELAARRQAPKVRPDPEKQSAAVQYSLRHRETHWNEALFKFEDLQRLIPLRREMVELLSADDRAAGLNILGNGLQSLFSYDGVPATLEESISVHREALSLRPHPHPDRHTSLNNLGNSLCLFFEQTQRVADIEEAISVYRKAIILCPYPHPSRPSTMYNLGNAFESLFTHTQRVADIEEAISVHREALSLSPNPNPVRQRILNNLGIAISTFFNHSRSVADIEEAVSMFRDALSLCPHPHPDRHSSLNNLGVGLNALFECTGHQRVADIEEAISVHREALSLRPDPHPHRHLSLDNLGYAIESLLEYRRHATPEGEPWGHESQIAANLDEAISCTRELLAKHYLEGHKKHKGALDKLESLLQLRSELTGS
ncbi:hypothetical protein MD484_g564, partial [Candolleomyces efflorescens]